MTTAARPGAGSRALPRPWRGCAGVVGAGVSAALLAGCGAPVAPAALQGQVVAPARGALPVVAAENVYGQILGDIGGDRVRVTSLLTSPTADPHLFETDVAAARAVQAARVVILNGLGYDSFMARLLAAAPSRHRAVVRVSRLVGARGPGANPHLWYSPAVIAAVARAVVADLIAAEPAAAGYFQARAEKLQSSLAGLQRAVRGLGRRAPALPVAYTERVPGLLLRALGWRVLTPPAFARAAEDGTQAPVASVVALENLLAAHRVRVLLYNSQAVTPLTERVARAAHADHVPVIAVSETQPAGTTYTSWLGGLLARLAAAAGAPAAGAPAAGAPAAGAPA